MKTPGGIRAYERDVFIAGYMAGSIDRSTSNLEQNAKEAYRQWRVVRDLMEQGTPLSDDTTNGTR